ncbi:uncharacterized protein LOC101740341 isoform X2 [Bombyx mori]|uniref:Uncharacterized protein n=1 Tax=Bombyx mori TaxID=7091 RepID=A0A8R2ARD9_BOMMO|nr:uncharacterized protein LOC101740341 isoform X2 [Bombyx mori]
MEKPTVTEQPPPYSAAVPPDFPPVTNLVELIFCQSNSKSLMCFSIFYLFAGGLRDYSSYAQMKLMGSTSENSDPGFNRIHTHRHLIRQVHLFPHHLRAIVHMVLLLHKQALYQATEPQTL